MEVYDKFDQVLMVVTHGGEVVVDISCAVMEILRREDY